MADILSLTHYVTDIERFLETRDIRLEYFTEPYPVTATVQVARLFHRDLLLEISAIAEIPRGRFRRPCARRAEGGA